MRAIHLLPIGGVADGTLDELRPEVEAALRAPCGILPERLDPRFAYHPERRQYHSTEILSRARSSGRVGSALLLGVADVDLFIPILTFVFGEAQVEGVCAVVSEHRLRQEFYGLPPDPALLRERLLKEAVHEIGHTLGLAHCEDHGCAMAPSHSVEWIDVKGGRLCVRCGARAAASFLSAERRFSRETRVDLEVGSS